MYKNVCFQFIDYRFLNIALLKKILATLEQANSFARHPMACIYQYYVYNFYLFYQYYVHIALLHFYCFVFMLFKVAYPLMCGLS